MIHLPRFGDRQWETECGIIASYEEELAQLHITNIEFTTLDDIICAECLVSLVDRLTIELETARHRLSRTKPQ